MDNRKVAFYYLANNNNIEFIELYLFIVNSVLDSDTFKRYNGEDENDKGRKKIIKNI